MNSRQARHMAVLLAAAAVLSFAASRVPALASEPGGKSKEKSTRSGGEPKADSRKGSPDSLPPVPVSEVKVVSEVIELALRLPGSVEAQRQVTLASTLTGRVVRVNVDEGDVVAQGAELAVLDAARQSAALQRLRVEKRQAERKLSTLRVVHKAGGATNDDLATAEETVERIDADIKALEADVRDAVVRAPFNAVVTERLVEPGGMVGPSQPVLKLVDSTPPRLVIYMPERFRGSITTGTPVISHIANQPGRPIEGHVVLVSPVVDPALRTFKVEIAPDDAAVVLVPGQSVRAQFTIRSEGPVAAVPRDALVLREGRLVAFRIIGDEAHKVDVRLGMEGNRSVEVVEGLTPGDRVVVHGNESVRDKSRVRIVPAVPPVSLP